MKLSIPKGFNDSLPEAQILLNRLLAVLTEVFELYGFEPLDTPAVEMRDVLESKYAGGEEILKELYTLTDRGNRELALRYDLTVPFARAYGMYKPPLPFKRYQIGKVWRDGPTGSARYREFIQCDVDVVGDPTMIADAEFLGIASEVFRRLDIPVIIKVSNRKLLDGMVAGANIPSDLTSTAILSLDKLAKIGPRAVLDELISKSIDLGAAQSLLEAASITGDNEEILQVLESNVPNESWRAGVRELREVLHYAERFGVVDLRLDPSLARGLAYYTGTIVEVVPVGSVVTSSIVGGGRYDNMVGAFLQDGRPYPAMGISFGLNRILDVISAREATPASVIQVFIIPFPDEIEQGMRLASLLRDSGISADIERQPARGLRKSLRLVNAKRIPYAVIVGPDEVAQGKYRLRDMKTGAEQLLTGDEILGEIRRRMGTTTA